MSTGVIIAIVAVVVLILLLFALVMSPRAKIKRRERELGQRRERAVETHREQAGLRSELASEAEKRAQLAEAEAQRERAQAELHEARAKVHERGLADHELVRDEERDRFEGTSAVEDPTRTDTPGAGLNRGEITAHEERVTRDEPVADREAAREKTL
jgi:hypothetical protein